MSKIISHIAVKFNKTFSVQFSLLLVSDSLWPHGLQPTRLPCPSPTPRACSIMSIKSVMPSNHIFCIPLLLLLSICPSIRVVPNESACIRWPKYWSFSLSISPFNEYSGLIYLRIDWFDLAVQGDFQESSPTPTFKSINSLVLSFFYDPTLTSIRDYWKNHAAAAAKLLQSCPTLCDPTDGSPPGSPIPGILQGRTLEWVAIAFSHP